MTNPVENELDNLPSDENMQDEADNITVVDPTDEWTQFRLDMATDMFNT